MLREPRFFSNVIVGKKMGSTVNFSPFPVLPLY